MKLVDSYEEMFRKSLGKKIRRARREKEMTQEALAELCNITARTLSFYENGKQTLSAWKLCKIICYLDLKIDFSEFNLSKT